MKGQTQALTTVLITTVVVTAAASTYTWGKPLIDKRQGQSQADRMESTARDIYSSIQRVKQSGEGTTTEKALELSGGSIEINEKKDYIRIETSNQYAGYPSKWTRLAGGSDRNTSYRPGPDPARMGSGIGAVAVRQADTDNKVMYQVDFRNVRTGQGSLERTDLRVVGDSRASGSTTMVISHQGTQTNSGYTVSGESFDMKKHIIRIDLEKG
ncbi:MAG: hypothetical protein ABEJ03_01675 [Candidatus Nanohaloarchaea archaeon]